MPQACVTPAVSRVNCTPEGCETATGVGLDVAPEPSGPLPQQYAWPVVDSPQAKMPPTTIRVKRTEGGWFTITGSERGGGVPSPTCPSLFSPQQNPSPMGG